MDNYEEKYKKALEAVKFLQEVNLSDEGIQNWVKDNFPELKETEDEESKNWILDYLYDGLRKTDEQFRDEFKAAIAWLENQGKETSWKPSKEEMDVLYGLAYITNQYDEHKEVVITRLYQDLKREFFNGASYENMFPNTSTENDVRRRSILQVLEYARNLDAYNQYGKEDISKNIDWLEKQGKKPQGKSVLDVWKDMRLEVYLQASGNRHESNYSDDRTKMFSLEDIDEIIEKINEQKLL